MEGREETAKRSGLSGHPCLVPTLKLIKCEFQYMGRRQVGFFPRTKRTRTKFLHHSPKKNTTSFKARAYRIDDGKYMKHFQRTLNGIRLLLFIKKKKKTAQGSMLGKNKLLFSSVNPKNKKIYPEHKHLIQLLSFS